MQRSATSGDWLPKPTTLSTTKTLTSKLCANSSKSQQCQGRLLFCVDRPVDVARQLVGGRLKEAAVDVGRQVDDEKTVLTPVSRPDAAVSRLASARLRRLFVDPVF